MPDRPIYTNGRRPAALGRPARIVFDSTVAPIGGRFVARIVADDVARLVELADRHRPDQPPDRGSNP